ncbi:MAG TPA: YihY/virulence factor BrkB family protein [Terriglobia bacterium]|nr:YihY/virulence factor BrkB family protein [Terriglobia bacterium]
MPLNPITNLKAEHSTEKIVKAAERGKELCDASMPSGKWLINFSKRLWREIQTDRTFTGAAALAYFLLLAIFPGAIFVLSLLPYLPVPHMQQAIMDLLRQILPAQSAALFGETVRNLVSEKKGGLLTFGFVFTLWSASTGMYAIVQQLNVAYDVRERRPFWKVQGTALVLMLLFVILVIGSLSLVVFGGVVQTWLASMIGWSRPLLIFFAILRWIIIGVSLLLGLALIYRFGPDVNVKFRFISPGNVVAAILIAIVSIGVQFYVLKFGKNYNATYGSLGAVIILMLWLYLAGVAILVGGEVNTLLHLDESRVRAFARGHPEDR